MARYVQTSQCDRANGGITGPINIADKCNPAIIHYIIYTRACLTLTCQKILCEKRPLTEFSAFEMTV